MPLRLRLAVLIVLKFIILTILGSRKLLLRIVMVTISLKRGAQVALRKVMLQAEREDIQVALLE